MPESNVQVSEERLVAQHILSLMEAGRLLPGDHLPAERKLSADLSVSRAHVREAIRLCACERTEEDIQSMQEAPPTTQSWHRCC